MPAALGFHPKDFFEVGKLPLKSTLRRVGVLCSGMAVEVNQIQIAPARLLTVIDNLVGRRAGVAILDQTVADGWRGTK
jgi:hypothetical protein